MASTKKKPRFTKKPRLDTSESIEDSRAACPYTIRLVHFGEQKKEQKRKRSTKCGEDSRNFLQQFPFSPEGKFKRSKTMDQCYQVDPAEWSELQRYNSFILNGVKYFNEKFIFVANESTIDWVARILEIRARDEHHVYARVYWMYWPDELPQGTRDGKKSVSGRQPYHGENELIASNHMDIINVVSVTQPATVNQWFEENEEVTQNALYWRQALDVRTLELSSIQSLCKCGEPANPDKTMIGCSSERCSKWLHNECIKHEALMKTYERLGKDKPHMAGQVKDEKGEDKAKRPMNLTETGADSELPSIDVKNDISFVKVNGNIEVEPGRDACSIVCSSEATRPFSPDGPGLYEPKAKPYERLFEVELRMDLSPPILEFRDLRQDVEGGEKTWQEPINCLVCGSQVN